MDDNNDAKTSAQSEYREGDARFDVTSLDEVKDENGNGIFHFTTRYKWILALSILMLFAISVLIYAAYKDALIVEIWQIALWAVCWLLGVYAIIRKSLMALILNLILFFGVSLIPVWQSARTNFESVFKLFFD